MSTAALRPFFNELLKSLPPQPVEQNKLNELVEETLLKANDVSKSEHCRSQWEYLLKNDIFILATTEGKALKDNDSSYYDKLRIKLDVILTFTEHDACEQTFPFIVLQDILETHTIASCSYIFSWIEARAPRLTEGMVPQKGKALILLRTLNDLLRRLSKTGSTTMFCGRILTFLSGVFPLGERSGVNLRGEYGPTWEGVKLDKKTEAKPEESKGVQPPRDDDAMLVDSKEGRPVDSKAEKKEEFYSTFWSLQLPFSKPTVFISPNAFNEFKEAVNKVLPVIKEATAKERAMMGSRAVSGPGSLKRKREPDAEDVNITEYFFAKFLTSPDLLDLEVADTHFRRQFLFQLLVLLNHLLTFTKTAKASWCTSRNRSLQMDFTLEVADAQWVQETINKAMEELRQTTPNGRAFAETAVIILEREKNWIKWKNELCAPFDKEPWSAEVDGKRVGLLQATQKIRQKMRETPEEWEWKLGSQPLTEIWEMGCRGLEDLQQPFQPGDVKDFVKKVKQEDMRIDLRKKTLARTAERIAQAKAKAVAEAQAAAEKEVISGDVKMQEPAPEVAPPTGPSPPVAAPLHPSLPAKPGTASIKPPPPTQEAGKALPASSTPSLPPTLPVSAPSPTPALSAAPAPSEPPVPLADDQILKFEENKTRWAWLALRTARDQYLQHFGKIGTGDIEVLGKEIEKEKQEKEKTQKSEDGPSMAAPMEEQNNTLARTEDSQASPETTVKTDNEGDVKMEEN